MRFITITKGLAAWLAAALLAGSMTAPARAQGSWQFALTPYVWFAAMSGTIKNGPASGAEFDVPFREIFKSLALPPVMLAGEARNGRFGVTADLLYLKLKSDLHTPGPLFGNGELTMSTLEFTMTGLYRLVDMAEFKLDAGAGFRLWRVTNKIKLHPGILAGTSDSSSETFVDPLLAMRALIGLPDGWSISLVGDVGGFGVSSDLTWQAMGTLNYQVVSWAQLRLGWRYIAVDRKKIDVELSGPIIGATARF